MTTAREERPSNDRSTHLHEAVPVRVLEQRDGVPYEVSMKVCVECNQVDEQPVRRAAA